MEAGMQQDTENKDVCKHKNNSQTFLVPQTRGMAYINGKATKLTVCINNCQNPFIIESDEHCSIVTRKYQDNHFPNWEKKLFPTKEKNLNSSSEKMTSIGIIIKEMIIPHSRGNIRLKPEFLVLEDAHIQKFSLGKYYQRIHGIDIYNSKNRHITIDKFLNEFKEGQFSANLTRKQNLSLLEILRKNRPPFTIGEEHLGKMRAHDIELYLDVEIPYPPILRRPPYSESVETRKEIEKHINELLDMDIIRKIGHN
ncbi:hypothetical protein O181_032226 [Austropuccinia psidii MF-1]|uniref:Uncharacterized protein n=1 Tax=Austropuccinia psidii MF-1 TaxID=1389203 RepID=A0A9Q3CWE2_9BASI|nr:hypothetical protein [Austropuccinia psidii MF-1]